MNLQLPMQSVHITTGVVSANLDQGQATVSLKVVSRKRRRKCTL